MNDKKIKLYIDLAFGLVFISLFTVMIPFEKLINKHFDFLIALIIYVIGIYIINRVFNIAGLFLNRKFVKGSLIVIGLALMTYLMSHFPFPESDIELTPFQIQMRSELRSQMIWFLFMVLMGFCFSFGLLTEFFRQKIVKQQIETEKNKAELALYKAQINPHFLFNTLNTLYGLAITQSEHMESAFIRFSDILKYMYSNADKEHISIEDEINYINEYIELQKLRLNNNTTVTFTHKADDNLAQLPPMVLITFVENSFKYGTSSTTPSEININLELKNNELVFSTQNRIVNNHTTSNSAGMGIDNCRKRLDLLYPNKHHLEIDRQNDNFALRLTITL